MAERTVFDWQEPITWDGPGAIDGVVEKLAGDRLERVRYAEFLTNYLAAEGKQRNYVLNLNAEWGAGKTWFIKRWYMELKAHYPTVYIDAWQQDFSDDPLLTVISSIIEQLKEEAGSPQLSPYLSTKLASLLKATAPIITKALFKKSLASILMKSKMSLRLMMRGSWLNHFFKTLVKRQKQYSCSNTKYSSGSRPLLARKRNRHPHLS